MSLKSLMTDFVAVAAGPLLRTANRPIRPRFCHYTVTARCNLGCDACDFAVGSGVRHQTRGELSVPEIEQIFSDPELSALWLVRLTGGEPLLRADLADLILAIHRSAGPRAIWLTTSASMPDRLESVLTEVLTAGVRLHLAISLDADSAFHDELRGSAGLFDRVMQSCAIVARLQRRFPLVVNINQVVSPRNLATAPGVLAIARRFGFGYKSMLQIRYNENLDTDRDPMHREVPFLPAFDTTTEELHRLYDWIAQQVDERWVPQAGAGALTGLGWRLAEKYLALGERSRLFGHESRPKPACHAGFAYFRLTPHGRVITCTSLKGELGDLRTQSFSDLWHGRQADSARRRVRACKGCWLACDIGPSAYFSGDLARKLPQILAD